MPAPRLASQWTSLIQGQGLPSQYASRVLIFVSMLVQFDLFLHSGDVIAENELRKAIRAGNVNDAKYKFNKLAERNPEHRTLGPAAVMIKALDTACPHDPAVALTYLDRLEGEWAPAAETIFGDEAKALLTPFWRAVGHALESMVFDPDNPGCHASRAYLKCGDWKAAMRAVQAEPGFENQPVLLERMVESLWQSGQSIQAIEYWFTLCWLAPKYFEELIENGRIPDSSLLGYWNEAMDADIEPEISAEWYPAWVLLHEPGLAHTLETVGADAGPERAFQLVRELMMSDDEQLELRQELRDIHPGLFRYFLQTRVQFLQG